MRICILFFVWAVLVPVTLYSEELAITPDGRTVVLESDGSWRYRSAGVGGLDLSAEALAQMAKRLFSEENYEVAEEYSQRAADLAQQLYGEANFVLGMSRFARGYWEDAVPSFEACVETGHKKYASTCSRHLERIRLYRPKFYDPPLDWGHPMREIIAEEPDQ